MKRQKFDGRTVVYSYGVRGRVDVPPVVIDQMRRANRLWNALVEIEQGVEARRHEIEMRDTTVADLTARRDELDVAITEAGNAIKAWKVKNRTAKQVPADLRAVKANAHREIRGVRDALKIAKEDQRERVRPELRSVEDWRRAAASDAGRVAVDGGQGLFWGTAGLVRDSYETARKMVIDTRTKIAKGIIKLQPGESPPELHFHRFAGDGTVRAQVMRQDGDPVRDPATLAESKWRNVVRLPHIADAEWAAMSKTERKAWARSQRIGVRITDTRGPDGGYWLELPVVWHRPLPDGADVCYVSVTRRLVAGKPEVTVNVTVRLPRPAPSSNHATAAVDLGWRAIPEGIRVAVIAESRPLPDCPSPWVRRMDGGDLHEVVVPQEFIDRDAKVRDIRSIRDRNFNDAKESLVEFFRQRPDVAERLDVDMRSLVAWESAGRLAGLVTRWRDDEVPADEAAIVGSLEAWRHQDKHLWTWEASQAAHAARTRREQYRIIAAWLTGNVGRVVVEDMDIKALNKAPDGAASDDNREQESEARRNARLASPGMLRSALKVAADGRGVEFCADDPAFSSSFHRECGAALSAEDRKASIVVECVCGAKVDQDVNAARMLLDASTGSGREMPGTARMLDEQGNNAGDDA